MSTGAFYHGTYKAALADADTGGGVLSLANPEGVAVIVTSLVLDVTTVATAACTLDAGIAAAATTVSDTLIDGVDVNAAVITADDQKNAGSNGAGAQRWEADEFLTVSMKTGAAEGLEGSAYVRYHRA